MCTRMKGPRERACNALLSIAHCTIFQNCETDIHSLSGSTHETAKGVTYSILYYMLANFHVQYLSSAVSMPMYASALCQNYLISPYHGKGADLIVLFYTGTKFLMVVDPNTPDIDSILRTM
jgi:hypothetical protein